MNSTTDHIQLAFHGLDMVLLPQKVIYLPDYKILLVSDLHLGKASHFVKHGIQVPDNHDDHDISRLQELMDELVIEQVIFLGDLFHSEYNTSWEKFRNFRERHQDIMFTLVLGNHDIMEAKHYDFLTVVEEITLAQCIFTHEPLKSIPMGYANIYGHIHPGVRLVGKGRQSMSLSCFMVKEREIIVPAFGSFTGIYRLKPGSGDQVYVTDGENILKAY